MTLEIPQQNKVRVSVIDKVYVRISEQNFAGDQSDIVIHKDNVNQLCEMLKKCAEIASEGDPL